MIHFEEYNELFLEKSWQWLNDIEIRHLTDTPVFSKEQQLIWFHSLKDRKDYLIYGVMFNGNPVGACGLKNITETDGEYWGYIGEKNEWGKGIGRKMLNFIENIALEKHLSSVWLRVLNDNERALNLYKKAKYVEENEIDGSIIMKKKL